MNEYTKRLIKDYADDIRKDLKEQDGIAFLFGEPFDYNDPDALLVMATCMTEARFTSARKVIHPFIIEKVE